MTNFVSIQTLFFSVLSILKTMMEIPCEKQRTQEGKKFVVNILSRAKKIELHNVEKGKYFRITADVIVDGKSIKNKLIRSKLVYPYYGGKKRQVGLVFMIKSLYDIRFRHNRTQQSGWQNC